LRKTGREFSGLSPFNKEKTPSFTVNDQKGFYHDFSSGKHGDIFGFVMETEGLDWVGSMESLAQRFGVELEVEDDIDVAPSEMEGNARPHAPAANDDDLGLPREIRTDHRAPDGGFALSRFPIFYRQS